MNKPEFIIEMEAMNNSIIAQKTELNHLLSENEDIETKSKFIEAELMDVITNEIDAAGKSLYSNADKRNAELKIRLADSGHYQILRKEFADNKKTIQTIGLQIEHTTRNFEIYKIMGYLSAK